MPLGPQVGGVLGGRFLRGIGADDDGVARGVQRRQQLSGARHGLAAGAAGARGAHQAAVHVQHPAAGILYGVIHRC